VACQAAFPALFDPGSGAIVNIAQALGVSGQTIGNIVHREREGEPRVQRPWLFGS